MTVADPVVWHQAPPCDEEEGWIEEEDVPVGASYSLTHAILLSEDYAFAPSVTTRVRELAPVDELPPRYVWRYMLDKMMFTLRNTTDGFRTYTNASLTGGHPSPFGFYAKTWCKVGEESWVPGQMYLDLVHSPDWVRCDTF